MNNFDILASYLAVIFPRSELRKSSMNNKYTCARSQPRWWKANSNLSAKMLKLFIRLFSPLKSLSKNLFRFECRVLQKFSFILLIGFFSQLAFALPLSVTPKVGVDFPTTYNGVIPVTAYYTVTNQTSRTRLGNYIQSLPRNVVQVRENGTYSDTCGGVFNLAKKGDPGDSCTLQLSVLGAVDGKDTDTSHLTFVCFPGGVTCVGPSPQLDITMVSPWVPLSVAYEIIYIGDAFTHPKAFVQTYKNGGTNPIETEDEFDAYVPPPDYTKNTPRNLQFNEQVFLASPGEPVGVTTYITTAGTPSGYTWGAMSNAINAMWPFDASQYTFPSNLGPFEAGNFTTTPPSGVIKVTANYKAQYMKFFANENGVPSKTPGAVPLLRFIIIDEWGNEYIMHASEYSTVDEVQQAFNEAVLPAGFTKVSGYLSEDLILKPAQMGDLYHYLVIRDNQGNAYHQFVWGAQGVTPANMVQEAGMPVWGGLTNDLIKIVQSFDYLIYGGGGVNVFEFDANLVGGVNTIGDFNGAQGDKLKFHGHSYSVVTEADGVHLLLDNNVTVVLSDVFYFDSSWVI